MSHVDGIFKIKFFILDSQRVVFDLRENRSYVFAHYSDKYQLNGCKKEKPDKHRCQPE